MSQLAFQTEKKTNKKDREAEKTSDTKEKSENGDKKQKAEGKRNNPNPRTTSTNSTKTQKNTTSKQPWYSYLAIGLVGIALGYFANEIIIPPKTLNNGDPVLIASLEQKFGDCLYWDWVDLKTPNKNWRAVFI